MDEVKQAAREFLLSEGLAEEALDGTLHGNASSDNSEIYKMANQYFKEKDLTRICTLPEFRDEIKAIIDSLVSTDAFQHDLNRND